MIIMIIINDKIHRIETARVPCRVVLVIQDNTTHKTQLNWMVYKINIYLVSFEIFNNCIRCQDNFSLIYSIFIFSLRY